MPPGLAQAPHQVSPNETAGSNNQDPQRKPSFSRPLGQVLQGRPTGLVLPNAPRSKDKIPATEVVTVNFYAMSHIWANQKLPSRVGFNISSLPKLKVAWSGVTGPR